MILKRIEYIGASILAVRGDISEEDIKKLDNSNDIFVLGCDKIGNIISIDNELAIEFYIQKGQSILKVPSRDMENILFLSKINYTKTELVKDRVKNRFKQIIGG